MHTNPKTSETNTPLRLFTTYLLRKKDPEDIQVRSFHYTYLTCSCFLLNRFFHGRLNLANSYRHHRKGTFPTDNKQKQQIRIMLQANAAVLFF